MGLRINTNVVALRAQRNLLKNTGSLNRALERLASGSRINRAGDDAAGLAVSEGLRSQVRGLSQAIRNANDGVGFLSTAEGALSEVTNIVQRVRELAIQAANGSISEQDRSNLNAEAQELIKEFDRIARDTDFNGVHLLDGTFTTKDLQVGTREGQTISFSIGDARTSSIGATASVSGTQNALRALSANLSLNGFNIDAAAAGDDVRSSLGNSYSAIAVAKKINSQFGETGVKAEVLATAATIQNIDFANWTTGTLTNEFMLNNVAITGTGVTNVNSLLEAINNRSTDTGIIASLVSGTTDDIKLTCSDGRNIEIDIISGATNGFYTVMMNSANVNTAGGPGIFTATPTSAGTSNRVLTGGIKLVSAKAISIASGVSAALGIGSGTVNVDNSGSLSRVSISNQGDAADALSTVDEVLSQLTNLRAALGAVQNRLESNMSNLGITSENLSAAQSQIRDADLAVETAELTKAQILQQAGIAVLGQANVSAQNALQLLQF